MNEIKKEDPNSVYQTHAEMVAGLAPAIGRTIKKIGLDEYHNTCRLVLDNDNVIFVQSVAGKEYFLKHGVVADVKSGSMAYGLANATTMTWANVQDEPTAESGAAKPAEAAFEHPAGSGSAPSLCSGLQACQATVNWVWIDWDEVACVNGVNNQELATVSQEIEVIFKSGKSLKVCLGQMMGFKNLSDCPLVSREAFEKQILLLEQYSHDLELRK